jgi:hypothetical protein
MAVKTEKIYPGPKSGRPSHSDDEGHDDAQKNRTCGPQKHQFLKLGLLTSASNIAGSLNLSLLACQLT